MANHRSDLQYRKDLIKHLTQDNFKKGYQPIPDWYKKEIMTKKSISSVKRQVKKIENNAKKYNKLKSQKSRSYEELAKVYRKLKKLDSKMSNSQLNSYINIFYKNRKSLLEKHVLLLENKYNKKSKKNKK